MSFTEIVQDTNRPLDRWGRVTFVKTAEEVPLLFYGNASFAGNEDKHGYSARRHFGVVIPMSGARSECEHKRRKAMIRYGHELIYGVPR